MAAVTTLLALLRCSGLPLLARWAGLPGRLPLLGPVDPHLLSVHPDLPTGQPGPAAVGSGLWRLRTAGARLGLPLLARSTFTRWLGHADLPLMNLVWR